jgi:hypothetical protein
MKRRNIKPSTETTNPGYPRVVILLVPKLAMLLTNTLANKLNAIVLNITGMNAISLNSFLFKE